eukprot:1832057-Pyramimonas_sp.AAC.1
MSVLREDRNQPIDRAKIIGTRYLVALLSPHHGGGCGGAAVATGGCWAIAAVAPPHMRVKVRAPLVFASVKRLCWPVRYINEEEYPALAGEYKIPRRASDWRVRDGLSH